MDRRFSRPGKSTRGSAREEMICTVRSGEKSRQPSDWARSAQRRGDCGPSDVHTEIPSAVRLGEGAQSLASGGAQGRRTDLIH
jgi:hypothetical protein